MKVGKAFLKALVYEVNFDAVVEGKTSPWKSCTSTWEKAIPAAPRDDERKSLERYEALKLRKEVIKQFYLVNVFKEPELKELFYYVPKELKQELVYVPKVYLRKFARALEKKQEYLGYVREAETELKKVKSELNHLNKKLPRYKDVPEFQQKYSSLLYKAKVIQNTLKALWNVIKAQDRILRKIAEEKEKYLNLITLLKEEPITLPIEASPEECFNQNGNGRYSHDPFSEYTDLNGFRIHYLEALR